MALRAIYKNLCAFKMVTTCRSVSTVSRFLPTEPYLSSQSNPRATCSNKDYLKNLCHNLLAFHSRGLTFKPGVHTRSFSTNSSDNDSGDSDDTVNITYIDREGEEQHIKGKVGDNVMYLAQRHDLDVEGACEASLACCTCHVYVETMFEKLGEIDEEEEDMLDLAPFLQENSRLSCQIILSKDLDGIIVRLPSATRNFYVDGHKPKPH